jgi:hypothetical protein
MSRWFRMYDSVLDDPKVQRLPERFFKVWVNVLCVASRNEGVLPPIVDLAFMLRMSADETEAAIQALKQAGLLDSDQDIISPHKWAERQYKSDTSTDRVKRFRERSTKQPETVSVTPPDTDTDTEQKKKAAPAKSGFETTCRDLVGSEPVLISLDFHSLEKLVEDGGVTQADVVAGITAAMAKPDFRPRRWGQFEGWARRAAQDRMAGKSKASPNGYKSPVTPDTRIWLPQGSDGYEAWRTAFPGVVKATLTTKGKEQGIFMPTEFPAKQGAAA